MKNSLNKIRVFKDFRKELIDKYETKTAEDIWRYANEEYMKLLSNEPDAEKYAREYVFPAVAIYRAVKTFRPGEEMEVTRAFGSKTGLRLKKLFRRVTALPGVPELMWRNMDRIAAKMSEGYEIKNLYVDSDKCDMDVVMCPLYDKAKEIGTPEAVQMICCMDKEYMNGFRGIDYMRTKSVAEGDECCDYRLSRSKRVYRGSGALTLGGIVLCTIFAGLCFIGYKKKD